MLSAVSVKDAFDVQFCCSGVIVANAFESKLSLKLLMEGGDNGVNGQLAHEHAEEVSDIKNGIVTVQRKY